MLIDMDCGEYSEGLQNKKDLGKARALFGKTGSRPFDTFMAIFGKH